MRFKAPDNSLTVNGGELSPLAAFANSAEASSSGPGEGMNILLLGSGGREDALAWRLRQSPSCTGLHAAPGNPGIARWAHCVAIDPCDGDAVVEFARAHDIDLVVVGPEAPLVAGVADRCRAAGISVFGPSAAAARLEGSKGFTKDLCARAGIPTAAYARAAGRDEALAALDRFGLPVVVKADGLAAGKGVTIATTRAEAEAAIAEAGGEPLVIEEFLEGEEASLFALVDGPRAVFLASAQDHKRVGDGDVGPNTGGMGAYAPAPVLTPDLAERAMREIVEPTARAMAAAGTPFSGLLYAGLMLTADGPRLIEYNVRFGDPECEAVMALIEGDFAALLNAVATGAPFAAPRLAPGAAMTVVVAAKGYPGTPVRGGEIAGLDDAERVPGTIVFHAGTKRSEDGSLVASGGRVLAVTATGTQLAEAQARAYRAVDQIRFADGFCRRDIGWRELERVDAA